jgi:nucleotide-binding universal stress UspA family protein
MSETTIPTAPWGLSESEWAALTPAEQNAFRRLRALATEIRCGRRVPEVEIDAELAVLRDRIPRPAPRPDDPEARARLGKSLEALPAAPPEPTPAEEAELEREIEQALAEVRAEHAAKGIWPPQVPLATTPHQKALLLATATVTFAYRGERHPADPEP